MHASAQSQGSKANKSGRKLEDRIEVVLRNQGFEIIRYRDWRQGMIYEKPDTKFAILDAPYKTIYDPTSKIEFLLINGDREILIEAKSQKTRGSFDEKLAFVFLTALSNMPEREYVLVMSGNGFRPSARNWIEKRAAVTPGFTVLRIDGLARWLELPLCENDEKTQGCTRRSSEPTIDLN